MVSARRPRHKSQNEIHSYFLEVGKKKTRKEKMSSRHRDNNISAKLIPCWTKKRIFRTNPVGDNEHTASSMNHEPNFSKCRIMKAITQFTPNSPFPLGLRIKMLKNKNYEIDWKQSTIPQAAAADALNCKNGKYSINSNFKLIDRSKTNSYGLIHPFYDVYFMSLVLFYLTVSTAHSFCDY